MLALCAPTIAVWSPNYDCARTAPFHPQIHNLGNVGPGGVVHAACAAAATRFIDAVAYEGRNVRRELVSRMTCQGVASDVLEVGCGVGTLTEELSRADHFQTVHAIDTSDAMIERATRRVADATFQLANGIDVSEQNWGVAVSAFMFHELPLAAQDDVLSAMLQSSPDVWIMDIHPSYTPSQIMLTGEPYLTSYLRHFDDVVRNASTKLGHSVASESLIDGHVMIWRCTCNDPHLQGEIASSP